MSRLGDDYDTLLAEAEPILEQFGVVEPVPDGELHTRAARLLADLLPAPVVTPPPAAAEYVALANRAAEYLAGLPLLREQNRDERGRFAEGGGGTEKTGGGAGEETGGGGAKAGGKGGRPSAMHDEATIRAAYDYHDPQTGLTAEVTTIRSSGPGSSTYVDIVIRDAAGNHVGEAVRTIRPPNQRTVDHSGMALKPPAQGQGFATRFNAHAEEVYRANGIEQITVNANIDVGGYSHARAGYDFASGSARAEAIVHMVTSPRYDTYPQSVKDQVNAAIRNNDVTPIELAMIGHTPGATMWPGKEMLLGAMWQGVKRL